jgi:hypothetical protein
MSGGQGGGCRFEHTLILLMNVERPATCRYHIPYVVAYVVGYVEDRQRTNSKRIGNGKMRFGKSKNRDRQSDERSNARRPCLVPNDAATSRTQARKRSTTGLSVRFFSVTTRSEDGFAGKSTGNAVTA